jgi:hypothetical protein
MGNKAKRQPELRLPHRARGKCYNVRLVAPGMIWSFEDAQESFVQQSSRLQRVIRTLGPQVFCCQAA